MITNKFVMHRLVRFFILVIVVTILCFTGCKDEFDPCPPLPNHYWGSAQADYNSASREYLPYYIPFRDESDNISIVLRRYNTCNFLRESFGFNNIKRTKQLINRLQPYPSWPNTVDTETTYFSYGTYLADGDAVGTAYILDTAANNYLEISHYDATSGEIEGSFQLRIIRDPEFIEYNPVPSAPDTILLTNGWFHTRESKE
jgi:hypothetical protein